MQPNRRPLLPGIPRGPRRVIPRNAPQGSDRSSRNAASGTPNEIIHQGHQGNSQKKRPPVCITLDSDGEEMEPPAKKPRSNPDEVICLDSDSDSDEVIVLDSDSESDSDDVIHLKTVINLRTDYQPRRDLEGRADARESAEPKQVPAKVIDSSHKKDGVFEQSATPLAHKSDTRPMPVHVAVEIPVLGDTRNDVLDGKLQPKLEPEPELDIVEQSESSREDTVDKDRAMPVQEAVENPGSASKKNRNEVKLAKPSAGGSELAEQVKREPSETRSELGHQENQDDTLATPTPDVSAGTNDEPDRDVLVEVHHETPSPHSSAVSERSEPENKENQEAGTSDSGARRILRSRISKNPLSQPEKAPQESIYANKKIQIGADYQTVMQPLIEDDPPTLHYDKECEEKIWSPRISETEPFIKEIRVVYWKAIWRQFKGRILFEDALQHLMNNDYDFAASLESIDQVLKKRPNLMRHPCMAQATRLATHGFKETVSMRKLRKLALPNFQLPEVHHYSFKFLNLCFFSKFYDSACICKEALCKPEDFEPRYGCSNCTKRSIEGDPMCLICQTYQQLTGEKRPARDVYFTDEEKELIGKWEQMVEQSLGRKLTREEFEKLLEKEKVKKWLKLEITEEEKLMLNFQHPKTADSYARMSNKVKGKHFVNNLNPFVLPLFPACKCDQSKETQRLIKKENLIVPEIPNHPEYVRDKEFDPWVDG